MEMHGADRRSGRTISLNAMALRVCVVYVQIFKLPFYISKRQFVYIKEWHNKNRIRALNILIG